MIISNTLVTNFVGRDGGLRAMLGSIEGSMMNYGRTMQQGQRQTSAWEQQMRAFGTTLRYALAGGVIFGLTTMIGKLNELQKQMGLIAALSGPSGTPALGTNSGLARFEDELSKKAVEARTSLTDLNASAVNFLSTVQGAQANEIPDIIAQIGLAAQVSQTPTEDLTKAVTTLNLAAGRTNNIKNITTLLAEWYHLISTVPGGIAAAPQIAQQLGPLMSIAGPLGAMNPEQVFAMSTTALQFGTTPATGLRGMQYFMQSLLAPKGQYAKAMAAAGFTPERLQQEGGAKFITEYLNYVRKLGGRPTRAGITRFGNLVDVSPELGEAEGLDPNLNIPGVTPEAKEFLNKTIGRIHGIRTALVLSSLFQSRDNMPGLLENYRNFQKILEGDTRELVRAENQYRDKTPLQAAAVALDTLRQTVGRDVAPLLKYGVSVPAQKTEKFLLEHQNVRRGFEAALAVALLGTAANRLTQGRALRRIPGIGRFLGGNISAAAGQAFVASEAVRSFTPGAVRQGQTPADALFVIVVGQIFSGGAGTPPGGGTQVPPAVPAPVPSKTPWWKAGARWLGVPALMAGAATLEHKLVGWPDLAATPREFFKLFGGSSAHAGTFEKNRWFKFFSEQDRDQLNKSQMSTLFKKRDMLISTAEANRRLRPFTWKSLRDAAGLDAQDQIRNVRPLRFDAQGDLILDLKIKSDGKTESRRVKLPAAVYEGGKVPVSRGRRKTARVTFSPGARK